MYFISPDGLPCARYSRFVSRTGGKHDFLDYKQGTLHMVKSLKLVDTNPLAPEAMPLIFKKF